MLRTDLDAPKKQRHTVKRIYDRLIDKHAMTDVSYRRVRDYVAEPKPQIRIEAGRAPARVFIPQTHRPGAEAEVDFGEVAIRLRGNLVTVYLFAFRMSFSGKAVDRVFASGGFEAFFEGHVHALEVLGGVPYEKCATTTSRPRFRGSWDSPATGKKPIAGWLFAKRGDRQFYCQPGIEGAHEKGGVEGDVGWFRRNHMVPVPDVGSLDELNYMIDLWDLADDNRRRVTPHGGGLMAATGVTRSPWRVAGNNPASRVFDVRDPEHIRERAYYNPPAQTGKQAELTNSVHAAHGTLTADPLSGTLAGHAPSRPEPSNPTAPSQRPGTASTSATTCPPTGACPRRSSGGGRLPGWSRGLVEQPEVTDLPVPVDPPGCGGAGDAHLGCDVRDPPGATARDQSAAPFWGQRRSTVNPRTHGVLSGVGYGRSWIRPGSVCAGCSETC
jgi:hypothetical protein